MDGVGNEELSATWKQELTDATYGTLKRVEHSNLEDLPKMFNVPLSLDEQFEFLGHTPNSHYDKYLLVKRNLIATRAPSLHNHLLYSPLNSLKKNNNYAPTSFRQRVLYFLFNVTKTFHQYISRTIRYKLTYQDLKKRMPLETPKDSRRRKVKAKPQTNSPGLSPEAVVNQHKLSEGYDIFKEQMLTVGTINVRNWSDVGGRLIMNACETKLGTIQVDKFVSLIFTKEPDGRLDLECNCPDFKRTAGDRRRELDPDGKWLDHTKRCMHIRLMFEYFEKDLKEMPNMSEPEPGHLQFLRQQIRKSCLTTANSEVVVVNHVNYIVFSVSLRLGDLPVFVKIHPTTHDTTSSCKCSKREIKNNPDYWIDQDKLERLNNHICVHIKAVIKYSNVLNQFLQPKKRRKLATGKSERFCKEKGRWISASLLKHKPKQKRDPDFQRSCYYRTFVFARDLPWNDGYVTGGKLVPKVEDGEKCLCGEPYDCQKPVLDRTTKLYTKQYPALVDVMMYQCVNQKKNCEKRYDFEENAIFVWSKGTCVADEIFCQFFACRGKREIHFSSFVHEMTETYKDSNITSAAFLSLHVFISCVMSWIINLDIDFRSDSAVCAFCGHNPDVLACDGVYVGVKVKYLTKLKDVAAPEKLELKPNLHRRFTRTLINGTTRDMKNHRLFLQSYCKQVISLGKKRKLNADLAMSEENQETIIPNSDFHQNELLEVISDHRCKTVLKSLFDQEYPLELAKTIAQLILNLNGTAALTNFFPLKDRQWLLEIFTSLQDTTLSELDIYKAVKKIKEFRTQFAGIVKTALRFDRINEIASFFKYLIETTTKIHSRDHLFMPDEPSIVEPYDPTTGIAYHFTEHGGQIRKQPKYEMEGKAHSANCDDVEEGTQPCRKNFQKTNSRGWSFCFLFFCPMHGHCYGFHIINGAEGRKDPFSALLKYLPVAPKLLFYDFACSLSEYSLNREPGYFENTEFCHDVFHSVNHTCPYAFSTESTANRRHYNTSCCEQFNSYFGKIKATGRSLRMTRFMLYAQYMIYLWNEGRTKYCTKRNETLRNRVQPRNTE